MKAKMDLVSLRKMKKNDLMELAKVKGIRNAVFMKKDELINALYDLYKKLPLEEREIEEKTHTYQAQITRKTQSPALIIAEQKNKPVEIQQQVPLTETQERKPDFSQTPSYDLPYSYNVTKFVSIVRDPYWVYTYWDLDNQAYQRVSYLFSTRSGSIRSIIRVYDITNIDFDGSHCNKKWDIDVTLDARNWYIYLGEPNKAFIFDLGLLDANGTFYLIARSNAIRMPLDGPSDIIDEKWMAYNFDELYAYSGGHGVGISSGEVKKVRRKAEFLHQWVSSGMMSSPSKVPQNIKGKDFFLEVSTELILYGRTKPDAHLTVEGKKVNLRPDGSFTIRYYLPDGERNLPVIAVSADGEDTRKVTVEVQKDTY